MGSPDLDIVGLEALLESATPGPWEFDYGVIPPDGPGRYADIYWVDESGDVVIIAGYNEFREFHPAWGEFNPQLICAAVNALPALIALARSQERLHEAARLLVVAIRDDETENLPNSIMDLWADLYTVVRATERPLPTPPSPEDE